MAELPGEAAALRAVALIALTVLVVFSGLYVTGGFHASPCRDDLAVSAYPRTFDVGAGESAVTITFVDGEPFTVDDTVELYVNIVDNDSNHTARVVWGTNTTGKFPVTPGDTLHVDNTSLDGVTLDSGDIVTVGWRGYEKPFPWYCLNERDDDIVTVLYGRFIIP